MARGRKTGGRQKGTKNKAVVAREKMIADARDDAARVYKEGQARGEKSAVQVMAEVMNYFMGLAAQNQPGMPDAKPEKLTMYLKQAADIAASLAPYQTPKLQATTLRNDTDDAGNREPLRLQVEWV